MDTPKHYQPSTVFVEQPIEMMYRSMSSAAFKGYCIGNVIKYISRFEQKGGDEDLDKAKNYIEFLRCAYHGESPLFAVKNKD